VTNSSPSIRLTSLLARSKGIVWFFLLLNVALYFFRPLSFPDVWWQWDDGRRIVHHATPAPHLTFGDPAVKFTDEYAVFESVLYLTAAAGGFGLLAVGYWVATTAPFWAAAMIAFRRSRQTGALAFALMAVCLILAGYIQQRPAVVGNLFLFMLAIGLLRPENFLRRGAGMIALGILFCLWSDTHSSYVIGLGTLGLFLAERVFREGRKSLPPALLLLGLAVLATALHPDGFGRWVFTLDQYRDRWGYVISSEMGPPSLPFQALIVAGFCVGLYLYFQSRQQVWWWLAVTTVMTLMSLSSYRFSNHLAALLLVSLAFHGRAAAEEGPPARTIAMIGGNCLLSTFLIVAALAELFLILPMGQRKQPWIGPAVSSTELIDQLGAPPRAILADAVVGSYAYYRGNLVTLNDTGMARYAPDTKRYYYYLYKNPAAFGLALDRLHVNEAVVSHRDYMWAAVLNGRNDWRLTRITSQGLLYERVPATALSEAEKKALDGFLDRADGAARLAFAVRLLPDTETLGFLRARDPYFDEGIYVALREALSLIPVEAVRKFYDHSDATQLRTTIRLLLLERLGRVQEAGALAGHWTLHGIGGAEEVPRAQALLEAGDLNGARVALEIVYPRPAVSPAYQTLRAQLFGIPSSDWKSDLLWNARSQAWFNRTTDRWNEHLQASGR